MQESAIFGAKIQIFRKNRNAKSKKKTFEFLRRKSMQESAILGAKIQT